MGEPRQLTPINHFLEDAGSGRDRGIYKPEPTHLKGKKKKMAACRGLGMQARKKRERKIEDESSTTTWRHPRKKVLCLKRSFQQAGAGIARKLRRDKGACREMGIKGVCLNKRILPVFTKFFCPTPLLPLCTMPIWSICLLSNSLVTSTSILVKLPFQHCRRAVCRPGQSVSL